MTDYDLILGLKTKACVNGITPDTIPNIEQQIEDLDEIVVHNTGDETISGDKTFSDDVYANDVTVKGLTVHGDDQTKLGKVVLSPNSQGANIELSDVSERSISIVQDHDDDDNCYLRQYPDNYYPVDENENPVAPSNATIMTSGLVAVDPRIVHTTGNEVVAGVKSFVNLANFDNGIGFRRVSQTISSGKCVKLYNVNTYSLRMTLRIVNPVMLSTYYSRTAIFVGNSSFSGNTDIVYPIRLARFSDHVEIWLQNNTDSNVSINCDIENCFSNTPIADGTIANTMPEVGTGGCTNIYDLVAWQ